MGIEIKAVRDATQEELAKTEGSQRLQVTVTCMATYNSSLLIPKGMNLSEAIKFAQKHVDEIPLGSLEYVPDSDELDEENCFFANLDDSFLDE